MRMQMIEDGSFLRLLGNWITRLRKSRHVSQDQLTEKAGLARGTISKIENGAVDPRTGTLARIAIALGIKPKRLLEFEG